MIPVVILAGGLATRLYPATRYIPKSLLNVAGRPFIDHQLDLLKEKGVSSVILCVGNLGELIEKHVGSRSRSGLEVQYSYDGNALLGTGGALKKAVGILPDSFMVLYGDSYLDIDYASVERKFINSRCSALMTVYRNRNEFDTSNIIMQNGNIIRYNKKSHDPAMEYIDYGLIVIQKKILNDFPAGVAFDFSEVLSRLVDKGQVMGFEVTKRFYEIGSISGIRETEDYIRVRKPDLYHG